MKNIHVLPTENSSRLSYNKDGVLELHRLQWRKNTQNIYITSDEEIKEGDWCYHIELKDDKVDRCYQVTKYHTWTNNGVDKTRKFKKIILTTDQDLIKDGVWGIDDDFLKWFVKNPSCEYIELKGYAIILPGESCDCDKICSKCEAKQEPGKEIADYIDRHIVKALVEVAKQKMYSEEDMKSSFQVGFNVGYNDEESPSYLTFEEWIKEYKKK
jgi:hypothetical protein